MMRHNVEFKNWSPPQSVRQLIETSVARLERLASEFPADTVFLRLVVEENATRTLYHVSLVFAVPERTLAATEERHDAEEAVREAFAEVERQLTRHKDKLRHSSLYKRRARREAVRRQEGKDRRSGGPRAMISQADVDALLARQPTPESPVLSVYLDVDQSRASNLHRKFEAALKARLRSIEQQLAGSEREAFRTDAARVERFVTGYEPHAKTLVLFADDSAGLFWSGDLRIALPGLARWEPTPYVRPLVEALDEHERYGVVLTDKERARIFTVFLGEIEEEREAIAAAEVRHKRASGTDHLRSDMHFQRQDDLHVRWHLRRVAELMAVLARLYAFDRLVLAGPVEATSELAHLLPRRLGERVAGTLRLAVDATDGEVLRKTLEIAERAEREAETARLTELFDRGRVGLDATLAALLEGRLLVLVYAEGFAARGSECQRCHALFGPEASAPCSYCGGSLLPLDDLVERALERARSSSARVEQVHGEAAERLLAAGGVGAILRF